MARAAKAYEAASKKGNVHASAVLGYFYEYDLGGKPRNFELALKYYRAAADKGDPLGLHDLAFAYDSGSLGLQRNGSEAARLALRALEERMRRIRPRGLQGGDHVRTGVRRIGDLHWDLSSATLAAVLYCWRHDLSASARLRARPLQFRSTNSRPLPVSHRDLRRRAIEPSNCPAISARHWIPGILGAAAFREHAGSRNAAPIARKAS